MLYVVGFAAETHYPLTSTPEGSGCKAAPIHSNYRPLAADF
ncbi:hypothetical protein [Providencia rustigianii]|nr:hypothetical protein [Providencia rustigianii]